jgi:hypothetical protein
MSQENTDLEMAKIELEREKLKLERSKSWMTSLSIFIPLMIAALTIAYNSWSQVQQSKTDFMLQAAELVIGAETPTGAKNKAGALAVLFPDQLPANFKMFVDDFTPSDYGERSKDDVKKTLEERINQTPEQKDKIIDAWILLFPEDTWVDELR